MCNTWQSAPVAPLPLAQVAVRALQQLLSMGAAGGAPGLAAVCERLPEPSDEAIEEAGLPPMQGGWDWTGNLGGLWQALGGQQVGVLSRARAGQRRALAHWPSRSALAKLHVSHNLCSPPPTYPPAHPPASGLSAAQRSVASRLPLLHEMFGCLTKPSCARELEAMCGCLSLAAEVLPPAFAGERLQWGSGAVGRWGAPQAGGVLTLTVTTGS